MTLLWLVLLGALHGLQPDHAAAAAALAARSGTSAWRAALRVAAGHCVALALAMVAMKWLPHLAGLDLEPWLDSLAGASLLLLGGALLFQVWRAHYVVHAHDHVHGGEKHAHSHVHAVKKIEVHEHHHAAGAIAVGLVLGLAGARSLAIVIPGMGSSVGPIIAIALYGSGIAIGSVGVSAVVDLVRDRFSDRLPARWMDLLAGAGAMASGAWILG